MVRTGEAGIASIGPEAIKEAQAGGMKVVSVPGTMQAVYQFWGLYRPEVKGSPLTDVRVREALSLAIDRQQIIDHVMAQAGELAAAVHDVPLLDRPRHPALGGVGEEGAALRSRARQAAPGRGRPCQRLQDDVLEHRAARYAVHGPDRRGRRRLLGKDRREGRDEDGRVGRLRSDGARRAEGPRRDRVDVPHGRAGPSRPRATRRRSTSTGVQHLLGDPAESAPPSVRRWTRSTRRR